VTEPLHVGVNLLWLVPGDVGGSEEYTTRALLALAARQDPALRVTLFALAPFADAHPELAEVFPLVTAPFDGRRRPERVWWEATWLPRELRRTGVDLVHHAGGVVPPEPRRSARAGDGPAVVLTIHDLQPLVLPEHFTAVKRRWLHAMLPRSAARADLVVTPSDPASRSVVELLGVPADRVHTVPHGVEPAAPVSDAQRRLVAERYRITGPVVLYPAIPYAHKDHRTLVAAFGRVAADHPDATLVLTGGRGPEEAALAAAIAASGYGERVRRTGRIPWDHLHVLYDLATVVAVPSRFEGFGAPALEAMAAGRALVAADATALPWVVGDGGVLVPVGDVDAWAAALHRLLADEAYRHQLAEAGAARARTFTWDRTAEALTAGYRAAAAIGKDGAR
jgi:alpha-1,3-rhamnosyl/mannosyltransferase